MKDKVSKQLLEKWLQAWSLSRKVPLPIPYGSGLWVEVGDEKQKERYVFSEPDEDFFQLSRTIDEPWVYLKVCASPELFIKNIPEKWQLQPQGYMMGCFHPMNIPDSSLPDGYYVESTHDDSLFTVRIIAENGEQAAIGHIVLLEDLAVYDRIVTEENHRRKGLGSCVMKELEKIALSKGVFNNFLAATEEGKFLYETLGWEVYSLYSSIVISPKI
ncbi:N-acetyltransferase [Chryseobacterium sp. G0186]|uniref:GNAT family N-acetyltransferase n=1 Tax=Chryseobacterium sp. G0186 TaxID=2487064 RepID=UPI000F4D513E|nr:GNAT family N-acetyltransferase [Chryseobacterium sp. G0186]AZA76798.1 N-acetyltransferase [Chryseobacterium sp. G0186]